VNGLSPLGTDARVLVVEDEADAREFLKVAFRYDGFEVETAEDGDEAVEILARRHNEFTAVILDLLMPRKDGITALREIRGFAQNLPVLVTSAATSPLEIVDAMRAGATDFIAKPLTYEDLRKRIVALPTGGSVPLPKKAPTPSPETQNQTRCFFGASRRMRDIRNMVNRISDSVAPVLIQGETGTGKEVLAREIHSHSPRSNRPFLKLNCAALPSELVESELFGYEKGAFTGAFQRKAGMFELADGGTILLDEIGDMDYKLQAKLLQVLQDREFQRLGGKDMIRVDVRVMAATHRNLEQAIPENQFREDLYYRLNVINIELPPLRERTEDILGLADHFIQKYASSQAAPQISIRLRQALLAYDWPGNIRELENVIRRFLILANDEALAAELMTKAARPRRTSARPLNAMAAAAGESSVPMAAPVKVVAAGAAAPSPPAAYDPAESSVLQQVARAKAHAESDAIRKALDATRWNRKQAAQLLNIDYKALLYKMKKLSIG